MELQSPGPGALSGTTGPSGAGAADSSWASGRTLVPEHLAAIVDNSDDAIVSIDLGGTILSWNQAATQMYGYAAEEALGKPIDVVIPEDERYRAEELEIRRRIAQGERIHHTETIRRHRDGRWIEVSLSISPVRDASGSIVAAAGIARDISERKLFQAKQHLAAIVDNSDDAIVSKDLDGTILSWNEAATQMYGYTQEEALGKPIDIVIPEDEHLQAEELEIRRRIAQGGRIHHTETVRRHKDGRRFDVSLSISPVRDASGTIVAAAGIARDISEQNRAFEAKQDLAAIVDNSDDAIVSKDLDGTILSWNAAATQMYGYTTEEALSQPIDIIIPEDERRAEELEIRRKIAQGERIHHTQTVRRHKDGRHIEVSLSISPVRDASGRIVAAAGIARDISEQNRAFGTNQHLAAIVDNSDDAIVSKHLDGTILSWNAAATQMYGYTTDEALGQPIDIVIPEDERYRAEELEIRRRIAQGERIHHTETIRRHRDGRWIEVSLSISPVRDSSGRIVAAAGIARDISERKLFGAKQHLAAIVDNSDDAIVSKDLDGTILSWNAAATQMYGHTAEEALGKQIDVVIPEVFRSEELEIRDRIAEGEPIQHRETRRRNRSGMEIDVSLSVSPVRDASGRIVAAADIARDISDRKRLEQEREGARGLLERFVDFAAHDFKTPMHHILWYGQEAARLIGECQARDGSEECLAQVRARLQKIVDNSFWMNRRTEALLRASALQGHRQVRTQVSAEKAFDDSLSMLRSVDDDVAEATVTRGPLPVLASDESLLGFLFQNLLQNACKYGRVGTPVEVDVSAVRGPAEWRFSVVDNGMGVEPHLREQIFEPHVRAPNAAAPGTGIGLTFCRRIVDWHGGRIWVDPARGGGSRFSFTIPDHVVALR
jgi:PAS domain S-box-containing protein